MTYDSFWPAKPSESDEREDRKRYYAEQRRLRRLEMEAPLSDFEMMAEREFAERTAKPILSIDKELK